MTNDKAFLRADLRDHLRRLDELAREYDALYGSDTELLRTAGESLARHILALVDDTEKPSVLKQLNLRQVLRFVDSTIPHDPRNNATYHGLLTVGTQSGDGPTFSWYVPPIDQGSPVRLKNPPLRFDAWWDGLVIRDANGAQLSRAQIVHSFVEPNAQVEAMAWRNEAGAEMANSPVGPCIRQICYEIVETMDRNRRILGFPPKAIAPHERDD